VVVEVDAVPLSSAVTDWSVWSVPIQKC